jgi:hypothetical protein
MVMPNGAEDKAHGRLAGQLPARLPVRSGRRAAIGGFSAHCLYPFHPTRRLKAQFKSFLNHRKSARHFDNRYISNLKRRCQAPAAPHADVPVQPPAVDAAGGEPLPISSE